MKLRHDSSFCLFDGHTALERDQDVCRDAVEFFNTTIRDSHTIQRKHKFKKTKGLFLKNKKIDVNFIP